MIAFKVHLNKRKVATVGVPGHGVISAILCSVRRFKETVPKGEPTKELTFSLGGLVSKPSGPGETLRWYDEPVRVGDTITIQIVDAPKVDAPTIRVKQDPLLLEKSERQYYLRLKKKYENTA